MLGLLGFVRSLLLTIVVIVVAALIAATLSWQWLFVAGIGLAVYYVGVGLIFGWTNIAVVPGRLVAAAVVLFFIFKLFIELARWTLHGTRSETLQGIMQPILSGFNTLFAFDTGSLCPAQQEYYWVRVVVLIIFLLGLVRLFRR